ncbi:GNAT family N-acetyltransferase [Halobacillus mangrovi]|uniref:GNAT family N-acetyltransferase n=1 Tax=Halobacillus mangrovi TaxID=402384 RepID=UPI003D979C55
MFTFTDRVIRILTLASDKPISPKLFLKSAFQVEESVCKELKNYLIIIPSLMRVFENSSSPVKTLYIQEIGQPVTPTFYHILVHAKQRSEKYRQVFINEGHILEFTLKYLQEKHSCLRTHQLEKAVQIISSARDLTVNLEHLTPLNELNVNEFTVRMAKKSDALYVLNFIRKHFGERWLSSASNAFILHSTTHIYIAEDKQSSITGFACFKQTGTFGPMGVALTHRKKRIGELLVLACFDQLKKLGHNEVLIEQAGPIEFYEKTCGAVIRDPLL